MKKIILSRILQKIYLFPETLAVSLVLYLFDLDFEMSIGLFYNFLLRND